MDIKKTIFIGVIVLVVVSLMGNGWQFFGQRRTNKLLDDYQNTAREFEVKFAAERARNIRLTELNKDIEERLTRRLEEAEGALGDIATGIQGNVETVDGLIEAISNIITTLEEYDDNS